MSRIFRRCDCTVPCGHPWWYRFQVHGLLHSRSTKTARKDLAQRILVQAHSEALEGKHRLRVPPSPLLSKHIRDYCASTTQTKRTNNRDVRVLTGFLAAVGDRRLTEVTPFQIERWRRSRLAEKVKPSTVNRDLNVVRGCFSQAVRWRHVTASPVQSVKPYSVDDVKLRILSPEEIALVLASSETALVLLAQTTLESLLRLSEALSLHRQDIGLSSVTVRRKGGAVARVPVTSELRTKLIAAVHPVSGYVFGEGKAGTLPTQQTATNRVIRWLRALTILNASHHTFRHTGASAMLAGGVSLRVVQVIGGWTTLRMLERYTHPTGAEMQAAVATMSQQDASRSTVTEDEKPSTGPVAVKGGKS